MTASSAVILRAGRAALACSLALLLATCQDKSATGPGRMARARFDLSALAAAASSGAPDVPLDSVRVMLTRPGDATPALDTVIRVRGDTLSGDSLVIRLLVELQRDPETFTIDVSTYGAGIVWYQATGTAALSASQIAAPVITAVYVGPGANATSVSVGPRDTVMLGGRTIALRATVYDASDATIAGVPVGYRLSDTTRGRVALPTYLTGTFTAAAAVRDSVWLVAETPTHLRDSTRIHIVPPPAQLVKVGGDSQSVLMGVAIPTPLAVRVLDALSGGFPGDTVTWTVVSGSASLSLASAPSDSAGYARVFVTPTAVGSVTVQASAPDGLTGSPISFFVRGTAGAAAAIAIVSGNGQTDTVAHALPQPLVVKVTDSLGNAVQGATVAFTQVFGPPGAPAADVGITDASGQRQITFTLGNLVGTDSVRASLVGPPGAVTFSATAVPAKASVLVADSGANQSGAAGSVLALPFVARVTDAYGNKIAGAIVDWAIRVGGGSLSVPTTTSDTAGRVRVTYTLPVASGLDSVRATLQGTAAFADFAATALNTAVAQVILDRAVDTIALGAKVTYHAVLKDSLGNVVSGPVTWTSTAPGIASILVTSVDSNTATALAGGVTAVIAASNGHADTAQLYVRALTTIAVAPADTVITAVGDSLTLRAAALDNFGDTVKTGVVLRFSSASPNVVSVGPVTGVAHLVGAGNGVVLVQDTVSKKQTTATLRVIQKVASIVNSPVDSIQVGVLAQAQIVATAKDRNGHPIGGKTFGWLVRNTGIATVNATGVVTGVALGQSYAVDTLVDSSVVFRDSTLVSVVASPPAKLSWAFDSIAIGNGGSVQVGLALTKLSVTPVVIRIHSSDTTRVKPTQSVITIPGNTPSGSVTLIGLAATNGPDTVIAQDTLGIYAPDTMLVAVISTVSFAQIGQFSRTQDFYVNQNETYTAQLLLSDPAPPGGLGITFVYGKPGTSSVTPSPAIVPPGQLTAQVVIRGLAAGIDSVIPSAGGFVGKFSYVHVAPDSLHFQPGYPYNGVVGLGQSIPSSYVYFTYGMDHILPLVASTATGHVTTPAADTIKAGQTSVYIPVTAVGLGVDTVTISASGWIGTRSAFVVTTPHAGTGGATSLIAGQPTLGYWYAYAEDSLKYQHPVVDTVTFTAVSRDTNVIVMDSGVVRMLPGNSSASKYGYHAQAAAGGDSAWIVVSAPGYTPDSFLVHVTRPTLGLQIGYPYDGRVGINTSFPTAGYVYIPYARPDTFWVHFTHTRRGIVGGPDSVRILPGQTSSAYFTNEGDTLGVDTMVTLAPGYVVQGGNVANDGRVIWTVDPLHVYVSSVPTSLVTISPPQLAYVALRDSVNFQSRNLIAPQRVTVTSSNPAALTVDSAAVNIPAGNYYVTDTVRVVGVDTSNTLRLHVSGAGVGQDSSNVIRITPTPLTLAVGYPYVFQPGFRLRQPNSYVYLPANAPDTVTIVLTHAVAGKDSLTRDTLVINKGQSSSGYFDMIGLDSTGVDTIFVNAPGFVTTKAAVVLEAAWVHAAGIGTSHLTTDPAYHGYVYLTNRPSGYQERPFLPETVTVVSTNPGVILIDSALSVNGTGDTARVRVDSSNGYGYYRVRFVGSGSAYIKTFAPTLSADSTPVVTVTGPSLYFAYSNVSVGVGQQFLQYVYVNNPVASDLWVHIARSDSLTPPAGQAFILSADSLKIPAGQQSTAAYDTLVGNVVASANLIARATGYGQATTPVQVNSPRLTLNATTLNLTVGATPYPVYAYTQDQSGNYRNVYAPLVISDSSSDSTVTAADSASRTLAAHNGSVAFQLTGFKKGSADIVFRAPGYSPDTVAVQVDSATLQIFGMPTGLGAGQTYGNAYVYLGYTTVAPVVVALTSSNPAVLTVPITVTVPALNSSAYFTITGVSGGTATISASSPITHAAVPVGLHISMPKLVVSNLPASVTVNQKYNVFVYTQDSLGTANYNVAAPLTVTLVSSDPLHTTFDSSTVTIPAGAYYAYTGVTFTQGGGATYTITATANGYRTGVSALVTAPAPPAPAPGAVSSRRP